MKNELMELGLSEKLCDAILDLFDTYTRTLEVYDKPRGKKAFEKHLTDIKFYTHTLKRELDKLSGFEKQLLNHYVFPNVFELKTSLIRLEIACQESLNKRIQFSRKEPFMRNLASELRGLLESNEIPVKKTRGNIFCKVLGILLDEPEDSERSFNLLRSLFNTPS
jgi:hypothetical protein